MVLEVPILEAAGMGVKQLTIQLENNQRQNVDINQALLESRCR